MVKKENSSYVGNSLLQTASNKRLGAGRFALLALKGNPKPPVKKVKVPLPHVTKKGITNVDATDDRSKISDMTISVGESSLLSRPALIKEVHVDDNIDVESSVLDMSMNSGVNSADFSLTRAYIPKTGPASSGLQQKRSTRNPFSNIGTSVKTPVQPFSNVTTAYQNHPSNKTVSQSLSHPKGAITKRSMTLNKGIVFSAPSPMTLNRFEVQLTREHNAPESKEYLEQQELKKKEKQKQLEKEHMKQAKMAVKEELKREFQREQGEGFEAQLEDNFEENGGLKKKSLVKKILGKIRPMSPKKKQQKQKQGETLDLQQDVATLDKESATAMVRQALLVSKQKMGLGAGTPDHPIAVASPQNTRSIPNAFVPGAGGAAAAVAAAVATADLEVDPTSVPFPVNEILMQQKQDSISDLDASFRQAPVMEIMMGSRDPQSRDDESVSTLGTPRVFQKLDSLLREPHPDPPAIEPVESLPPPPMVLSQDANPLIDQLESTEKSEGTAAVENRAAFCTACFMDPPKSSRTHISTLPVVTIDPKLLPIETEAQAKKTQESDSKIVAKVDEIGEEGVEARLEIDVSHSNKDFLLGERPMFDEIQVSSPRTDASHTGETHKSAFSLALDQAIREANAQPNGESIALFPDVHLQTALSPIEEVEEIGSPKSPQSPSEKEETGDNWSDIEKKDRDPFVIDLTNEFVEQRTPRMNEETANFESLMEIAASRLEGADDRYAVENEEDRYTSTNPFEDTSSKRRTLRLESPKQIIVGRLVDASTKGNAPVVQGIEVSSAGTRAPYDLVTPKTSGGNKTPLFDLNNTASSVSTGNFEIYEDDGGEMVICSDDPNKLPKSPPRNFVSQPEPSNLEETFSEGLFDLLPSDECSAKKDKLFSQPSAEELQDSHEGQPCDSAERKELPSPGIDGREQENQKNEDASEFAHNEPQGAPSEKNGDMLDHVFEYSTIVFCGKSPGRTTHAIKSTAPCTGNSKSNSVKTHQMNQKAGVLCGRGPLFFSRGANIEEKKDVTPVPDAVTPLPDAEAGIANELLETRSPVNSSASPKKHSTLDQENDFEEEIINVEPDHLQNNRTIDQGRLLLDHDDAYWDTLSTIASTTKDKSSSDSEKYMYEAVIPGPIPIEITTMASKDIEVKPNAGWNAGSATLASNNIRKIMDEGPVTTDFQTPRSSHNPKRDNTGTHGVNNANSPRLSRTGSIISGDDEIQLPPPHGSHAGEEGTGSKKSRVANLIAVFESTSSTESGTGTISTKETPGENTSTEGSGLLQAVTRSESGDKETPPEALNSQTFPETKMEDNQAILKSKANDKPCPEMLMESSRKSKQSQKSNRSVSWGFEEIYEARENIRQIFQPKLEDLQEDKSENDSFPNVQDPGDRAVLSAIAAAAAGSAVSKGLNENGGQRANRQEQLSETEEQNLFARTLELSRGLFGSLTTQDLKGEDEEVVRSLFSFGSPFPPQRTGVNEGDNQAAALQSPTSIKSGNGESVHTPIDVENFYDDMNHSALVPKELQLQMLTQTVDSQGVENSRSVSNQNYSPGSNRSPLVRSKIDILREQRTRALERFQLAKPPAPAIGSYQSTASRNVRDRDRLKFYSPSQDHLRATIATKEGSTARQTQRPHSTGRLFTNRESLEERDNDVLSTASSSSSAPSRKARELRLQLDEALKASKKIRASQEQLGTELRSFKSRYYRKNDEIEDHALQAIAGP
jgi:hypothetical protein